MFIIFSTEDGRFSSGLSEMFTWALICTESITKVKACVIDRLFVLWDNVNKSAPALR